MQDGSVVMTKTTVEGVIKAISGTIGGYGWYEMAQGDSMILRYHNGNYYTVQYRT